MSVYRLNHRYFARKPGRAGNRERTGFLECYRKSEVHNPRQTFHQIMPAKRTPSHLSIGYY